MVATFPEPSNQYVRAVILSLERFYSRPAKVFVRAKKLEPEWDLDRRVLGRAWTMLRPLGLMEPRTSGSNGHGGLVWEIQRDAVFPLMALMEALPYHAQATVYSALGYTGEPHTPKKEKTHDAARRRLTQEAPRTRRL